MKMKVLSPILLAILFSLTACGTKVLKGSAPVAETGEDITRPPVTVKGSVERAKESNPEEIVSYDDWKKRRQKAPKAAEKTEDQK